MVYLISMLLTVLFSYLYLKRKRSSAGGVYVDVFRKRIYLDRVLLFLLAVFPVWFITAFRYDVGTDYLYTYVKYFEHSSYGWRPYDEPLFQLLNNFILTFSDNYVWLFVITGAIINILFFYFIFKYSVTPITSIVIYFVSSFFFNSLNNIRQYLAMSIAVFAFTNKNFIKSLIIILFASMFHFSALLYVPVLLASKLRFRRKDFMIFSAIAFISVPFICKLSIYLLQFTKYSYFLDSGSGFSLLIIIVNVLIFIACLFYYDERDKEYQKYAILQLITVCLCIFSIFFKNEEFTIRLIRLPMIFQLILVPKIISKERNRACRALVLCGIVLSYFVFTFYTVYLMGGLEVFPYQFIFGRM